jgi:hypothetical protein
MMARRLITGIRRDDRGLIVELSGDGWSATADEVLRDIEFAWHRYGVSTGERVIEVTIAFSITGRYLVADDVPLDQFEPQSS